MKEARFEWAGLSNVENPPRELSSRQFLGFSDHTKRMKRRNYLWMYETTRSPTSEVV
jgi:hypothetical protein